MSGFVLDCSVTMSWFFQDEVDDHARNVLSLLDHQRACVPAIWPFEVANVLALAERRGRLTMVDAEFIRSRLFSCPIDVVSAPDSECIDRIISLCRQHGITAYDAAYLELAIRLRVPLATKDVNVGKAAKTNGLQLL